MRLAERLLQNRHHPLEVEEIVARMTNKVGTGPLVLEFPSGEEISVSGGSKQTPDHRHVYDTEEESLSGEGKTPIGHMVSDTHTRKCSCGAMLHIDYRAPV